MLSSILEASHLDILMSAAKTYRELANREFKIGLSNGESIRIVFRPGNFMHLAGLNKLTDLYFISSKLLTPTTIFKKILKGEITWGDLNASIHFGSEAKERIECLCRIDEVFVLDGRVVFGFDRAKCCAKVKFKSDMIFFKDDGYEFFITFGAALDKSGLFHYPETVFYRYDRMYLINQKIVRIVSVDVCHVE